MSQVPMQTYMADFPFFSPRVLLYQVFPEQILPYAERVCSGMPLTSMVKEFLVFKGTYGCLWDLRFPNMSTMAYSSHSSNAQVSFKPCIIPCGRFRYVCAS